MDESKILRAEQYVTKAHQIVASQRDRIERLRGAGYDTLDAEQTLRVFEKSLRTFEDHRDWVRNYGPHFWPSAAWCNNLQKIDQSSAGGQPGRTAATSTSNFSTRP